MNEQSTYTVTSPLHHGRLFRVDEPITLTQADAEALSAYLDLESKREADPAAMPVFSVTVVDMDEAHMEELRQALEEERDRAFELELALSKAADAFKQATEELRVAGALIVELTEDRDALKIESEQLKVDLAAAAKTDAPAAKVKK